MLELFRRLTEAASKKCRCAEVALAAVKNTPLLETKILLAKCDFVIADTSYGSLREVLGCRYDVRLAEKRGLSVCGISWNEY